MTVPLPGGVEVRIVKDAAVLANVAADVFDHDIDDAFCHAFFAEPGHHLCVAIVDDVVIGFASAVDYVHPDKPRQLWINEVGVAGEWRSRGIGRAIIAELNAHGRRLGCTEAWVLTDRGNMAARAMYAAAGGAEGDAGLIVTYRLDAMTRDAQ